MTNDTSKPIEITEPNLIIVEGKGDQVFFEKFVEYLGLKNIHIKPFHGKTELRTFLLMQKVTPGFNGVISLGIIRDADEDNAFQSVCDALKNAGLDFPNNPLEFAGTKPKVAVLILPSGGKSGMLEDVCLESVINDPAFPCVEKYFQCLEDNLEKQPKNISKAKIQAFLASKRDPYTLLGRAAEKGYWPFNNPAFTPIKQFLTLFNETI